LAPVVEAVRRLPPPAARDLAPAVLRQLPAAAWGAGARLPARLSFSPVLLRAAAALLIAVGIGAALHAALRGERHRPAGAGVAGADAGRATGAAIRSALAWLQATQEASGRWAPAKWGAPDQYAVGITALAVLACEAGGANAADGPRAEAVRRGIGYLAAQQNEDGTIGPRFSGMPYNHALATLALLRAGAAERTAEWTNRCRRAVEVLRVAQTPAGGWGYGYEPAGAVNASVTVWQLQALLAAEAGGCEGLDRTVERGLVWLVSAVNEEGWMGYGRSNDFPYGHETMTAAGLMCMLTMSPGAEREGTVQRMVGVVLDSGQAQSATPDYCRSYFVARALDLVASRESGELALRIREKLISVQARGGGDAGSWSPSDQWGTTGGRVYATAMSVLALNSRR